uniref:Uncharacterized protein LOC114349320 n=1 Tax=Diabrotica virgifera virgifera TaxID=50390 RepID=A0A6P7HCW2_DIAVI
MSLCPNCKQSTANSQTNCKQSTANSQTIKCSGCTKLLHTSCIGLQSDDASRITRMRSKNIKVICNICDTADDKFEALKEFLTNLIENKMQELEKKFASVNSSVTSEAHEDIIQEAVDRINRSHNIILHNVPETNSSLEDKKKVDEILTSIQGNDGNQCNSINLHRIDKPSNKARLIK